jgi:hypothetical protein
MDAAGDQMHRGRKAPRREHVSAESSRGGTVSFVGVVGTAPDLERETLDESVTDLDFGCDIGAVHRKLRANFAHPQIDHTRTFESRQKYSAGFAIDVADITERRRAVRRKRERHIRQQWHIRQQRRFSRFKRRRRR